MIHLDTSFLIPAMVRGSAQDKMLRSWLRDGEEVGLSSLVWAEFLCGPVESGDVKLARGVVRTRRAFTEDHAPLAARLFNESGRRRGTLVDCMIAATALADGVPLATENPEDFHRFVTAGLEVLSTKRSR